MRLLALALPLLLVTPAQAQEPGAFIPPGAAFVMRWKNPEASIARAEAFMLRVGLAPPGAQKGFLRQQLEAQAPAIASIDMSKPIWGAGFGKTDDPKPMFAFTLKEDAAVEAMSTLVNEARVEKHGRTVVLVDPTLPAGLGKKKQKTPYRFASPTVATEANVSLDLSRESLKKLMNDSQGGQPELKDLEEAMAKFYEGMEGITIGAQLGESALMVTVGSVYGKSSVYSKGLAKLKNEKGSVLEGLPAGQYAFVGGGNAAQLTEDALPIVQAVVQSMKPALTRNPNSARLAGQFDRLVEIVGDTWGASKRVHLGIEIPAGLESTRLVGYIEGDGAKIQKSFEALFDWMKETLAKLAEGAPNTLPFEFVKSAKPTVKDRVAFSSFGMKLKDEQADVIRQELGVYAPLLEQRVQLGRIDAGRALLLWGNDPAFVQRAIDAAKKPKSLAATDPRLKAASDALPQARFSEAYLDLGPLMAAIVAVQIPAMASTVRSALGAVPPIGYTLSKATDSEIRTDVFVPLQLIEAGIGLAQLMRGAGG